MQPTTRIAKEEELMVTTLGGAIRELDSRSGDGLEVRLLWNAQTDQVSVLVEDSKTEEAFELEVDPADALTAFHHPFAYITDNDHALAA
jgi:hypothetical protein